MTLDYFLSSYFVGVFIAVFSAVIIKGLYSIIKLDK